MKSKQKKNLKSGQVLGPTKCIITLLGKYLIRDIQLLCKTNNFHLSKAHKTHLAVISDEHYSMAGINRRGTEVTLLDPHSLTRAYLLRLTFITFT